MSSELFRRLLVVSLTVYACDGTAPIRQEAQNKAGPQAAAVLPKNAQTEAVVPKSLLTIGQRTLDALTNVNPDFLASVVDDSVALGTDNPITSGANFKQELKSRTGAYCDLFGCKGAQNSVRNLLSGKTLAVRALTSEDPPGSGQVDVFEVKPGQNSPDYSQSSLLTFFFVSRRGAWRLAAIEYT